MSAALMLDCSQDSRPLIGHLGLVGCRVVARYSHAGATDANGNVPKPVASPLSAAEAQAVLGTGLAALLIANNFGTSDVVDPTCVPRKVTEIKAAAAAIGYPEGCLVAADFEGWLVSPDFLQELSHQLLAAQYRLMLYGSSLGAWRPVWEQVSAMDPDCVVPCWTARYLGGAWDGTIPPWDPQDDGGANTLAWQWTDKGPAGVDLSEIQPGLLAPGNLWTPAAVTTPAAVAPSPAPQPAANIAQVLAQLRQIIAEAQAAEQELGAS